MTITNKNGKNLFHIAAAQARHFDENVEEIYRVLKERKVDPLVKDNKG